jgi:hypothetical protein
MTDPKSLHADFTKLMADRSTSVAAVRAAAQSGNYTPQGVADMYNSHAQKGNWNGRLQAIRDAATSALSNAQSAHDAAVAAVVSPDLKPKAQLAFELKAARTWDRHRRDLDGTDPQKLATSAVRALEAAQDPAEVSVLAQELPAYLKRAGVAGKGGQDADSLVKSTLQRKFPEIAQTARAVSEAQVVSTVVEQNAKAGEKALSRYDAEAPSPLDPSEALQNWQNSHSGHSSDLSQMNSRDFNG